MSRTHDAPNGGQSPPPTPQQIIDALPRSFVDIGCLVDERSAIVHLLSDQYESSPIVEATEDGVAFVPEVRARLVEMLSTDSELMQNFDVSVSKDGTQQWFHLCVVPFDGPSGAAVGMVMARDVSEQRHEQLELAARSEEVLNALDASNDLFYVYGPDGRMRRWNDAVERVTGYTEAELRGADPTLFFPESEHEHIVRGFADVFETGSNRIEATIRTKDDHLRQYEFYGVRAEGPQGDPILSGIGRDISERVEREQHVAVLSRVLRHNVRNKMTVVDGRASHLASRVAGDHVPHLEKIQAAASDLLALSETALDITRLLIDNPPREQVDFGTDVAVIADQVREAYPDATVETAVEDSLTVLALPEISRAVAELLDNACKHNDDPQVTVSARGTDDGVEVVVADDGSGLPPTEANIVTESRPETPVFHSIGIGLWLVRWLVRLSEGTLDYREADDGGARFKITLETA